MISLDGFWNFVSYRPGLSAAASEWRACLGDDGWLVLRNQILVSDGIISTYTRPSDGRPLRVVPMTNGTYGLVCDATGNLEETGILDADVRNYRLNPSALRSMIAEALGITPDPRPIRDLPRAFPLGTWAPMNGMDIATFVMLPPTSKLLVSEIRRLLADAVGGFILFVPKQPKLESDIRTQLERKQASVVPLYEVLAWDSASRLYATPSWQTYCNAYCSKHLAEHMVPAQPDYQFIKKGMWTIRFAGKETYLEGPLRGPVFIRYLLERQGQEIHVAKMLADIAGDERLAQASDAGDSISKEEIAHYRKRYDELKSNREEAVEWNDAGRLQTIDDELGQIVAHLSPLLGLGGRSRKASDDVGRIRKAIARVIGIALDKIEESDPQLATHFRNSIQTHTFMSYQPENRIDWIFE